MEQKQQFIAPRVLQTFPVLLEEDLLAGSVMLLDATGQVLVNPAEIEDSTWSFD